MHTTALLAAAAGLFAAPSSAAPAASSPPLQITSTEFRQVKGGNTTLTFTVYDPDPLTNATQVCTGLWESGTDGYPQGSYEPCGNSSFAWNMVSFDNIHSFILGIEHEFEDPAVGQFPFDTITNFADANVTKSSLHCTALHTQHTCRQLTNSTVDAPIYATIAKRK